MAQKYCLLSMCEVLDSIPTLDGGTGPCNGPTCSSMLVSSGSMGQWEVSHLDSVPCSLLGWELTGAPWILPLMLSCAECCPSL